MECEAAAVRTALTWFKRASTPLLEDRSEAKLGVPFTLVYVCLKRKNTRGGLGIVLVSSQINEPKKCSLSTCG